MTRAAGLLAVIALGGCQCGFDAGKLDDLACRVDGDCRPDQDCLQDTCTQRPCSNVAECGARGQFGCLDGFCEAEPCDEGRPCHEGFECHDGLCTAPVPDAGADAGVDAAVPCGGPAECDDGLGCTDDACVDGFCSNAPQVGYCAIDGACWLVAAVNPSNACQVCDPVFNPVRWRDDDTRTPSDGIDCTDDRCEGGQPLHTPDDAFCLGRTCSPCAGGCIDPPDLTVDCPDVPGATGGAPVTCTVSGPAGVGLDRDCLSCTPLVGMTSLVSDDFAGCPSLSAIEWQGTFHGVNCPGPTLLGPDTEHQEQQLVLSNGDAALERWVDTTDFDAVRLCFDVAFEDYQPPELLTVELDAGGGWTEAWSSAALSPVEESWRNVCLDLVDLEPLAAGNPVLGFRFLPGTDVGGRRTMSSDVYLDNVAVDAWASRTLTWPGRVFTSDFTGCATDDWSVVGDLQCPTGGNELLEAAGVQRGTLTLSRALDLGTRCDGLRLGLSVMSVGADRQNTVLATLDRGAGPVMLWGVERGPEPESVMLPFEASVSHVVPAARFGTNVNLTVAVESRDLSDTMAIDDVWFDGAECLAAPEIVSATGAVGQEDGLWNVDVTGAARATAYLQCTWDGRVDTIATDVVRFCPDAECAPGTVESRACGDCGTQSRRCDAACRWLDWSSCADHPCSCCDEYGANCTACCC